MSLCTVISQVTKLGPLQQSRHSECYLCCWSHSSFVEKWRPSLWDVPRFFESYSKAASNSWKNVLPVSCRVFWSVADVFPELQGCTCRIHMYSLLKFVYRSWNPKSWENFKNGSVWIWNLKVWDGRCQDGRIDFFKVWGGHEGSCTSTRKTKIHFGEIWFYDIDLIHMMITVFAMFEGHHTTSSFGSEWGNQGLLHFLVECSYAAFWFLLFFSRGFPVGLYEGRTMMWFSSWKTLRPGICWMFGSVISMVWSLVEKIYWLRIFCFDSEESMLLEPRHFIKRFLILSSGIRIGWDAAWMENDGRYWCCFFHPDSLGRWWIEFTKLICQFVWRHILRSAVYRNYTKLWFNSKPAPRWLQAVKQWQECKQALLDDGVCDSDFALQWLLSPTLIHLISCSFIPVAHQVLHQRDSRDGSSWVGAAWGTSGWSTMIRFCFFQCAWASLWQFLPLESWSSFHGSIEWLTFDFVSIK